MTLYCNQTVYTLPIIEVALYIDDCCMKPSNVKGATLPAYTILAQVNILAQIKLCTGTGQNSFSAWTVN